MEQVFQEQALQYRKLHTRRKWLRMLVRTMAAVVVFCTTYALILPAITMEKEPVCGMEAHEHSFQCYVSGYPFQCQQMYSPVPVIHIHEDICFNEAGETVCILPEIPQHIHGDTCYVVTEQTPCTLMETEGHTHTESCWESAENWQCGLTDVPAHEHSQACYITGETYTCGQEETSSHRHEDTCYAQQETVICGREEAEAHIHGESCYHEEWILGCGQPQIEPHTHGESCYQAVQTMICGMDVTQEHTHDALCYIQETNIVCKQSETSGHLHDESCYIPQRIQICTLPETEGHRHGETCFQRELVCQTEETTGHTHTDLCREQILNCILPEGQGHSHTDECLKKLVCTQEETEPHTHTEACQGGEIRKLICTQREIQPHTHGETCGEACEIPEVEIHVHTDQCLMTEAQASAALVCSLEKHIHDDTCYDEVPFPTEEGYLCGFGSHNHNDQCRDENGDLTCNIPEHIHNIACVLENYDPIADMESPEDWEATFCHIKKTGHLPTDVLAVARTQLGYRESERNCFLYEDGTIRGYTRYGAWYGSPYEDWCAMFVSFCLHYAGVENFPLGDDCNIWAEEIQKTGAYHRGDGYIPKPGDLVFFNWDYGTGTDSSLDHVGLISEITADGVIVTIEGDSGDTVRYCTYLPNDVRMVAYGELPEGNPEPTIIQQTCTGPDYTVTVTYDPSVSLPEDAELTVREILRGSEEYDLYYSQAVEAVQLEQESETEVEIPFARFFDISFVSNGQIIEPEGPVEVCITYLDMVPIEQKEEGKVVHFADSGVEVLEAQTNTSENLADTFTFTQNSFSVSGTVVTTLPGMSRNLTLAENTLTDAFLYDPLYSQYYNANSPIGTAGSFHIVAFDTASLNTHTNGNVLAKNLYANSNFGTNNYGDELTYIQNYKQINGGSASSEKHILVIGSGNNLTLVDNGNAFAINGHKIDRPKNLVQDADTAAAPFIDLERVKSEVRQLGTNLAGYEDTGLSINYQQQYNRIVLEDPDGVGILNVTPSSPAVFGKHQILLDGFRSGYNGSIVITVNCAGYSTINLPNEALVVVDGQVQGTNEVVEFSNGKVLWNFINASGVTINAYRMTGMIIAPGATVNINQNLNGTVVADVVNVRAESHRTDFTGKIIPKIPVEEEENGRSITIQKIKAGYVGTTLAGAKFELYKQHYGEWQKVDFDLIITDHNGLFLLTGLETDTAYRLVEIEAPTGYILSMDPFDFWIRSAANITAPPDAPANFRGVAVDSGSVLNISNEPDNSTDTTSLTIKKEWIQGVVAIPTRISVDIYQIATTGGQSSEPVLFKTVVLTSALNWEYEVTDLPKSVTNENGAITTYTYSVQEHPVPGYTAYYSANNARGITEETILITNKETGEGYVLPETGGMGIRYHTVGGMLLTIVAFLYGTYDSFRKRRENQF